MRADALARCLTVALLLGPAMPAAAHEPMDDDCRAPVRPADEQNDASWRAFLDAVAAFQACITAHVDRHSAASDAHQAAARDAVDAWNRFVRDSLNAPEDYPWPPE